MSTGAAGSFTGAFMSVPVLSLLGPCHVALAPSRLPLPLPVSSCGSNDFFSLFIFVCVAHCTGARVYMSIVGPFLSSPFFLRIAFLCGTCFLCCCGGIYFSVLCCLKLSPARRSSQGKQATRKPSKKKKKIHPPALHRSVVSVAWMKRDWCCHCVYWCFSLGKGGGRRKRAFCPGSV